MKKIALLVTGLSLSVTLSAFDCDKAAKEIYDLNSQGKYKEMKESKIDSKFAWNCADDYDTMILIGNVYFHKIKNYVAAGSYFEKAISKHPEYPLGYLDLAAVKIKFEEFDEAVELCDKMLATELSKSTQFQFNAQAGMALFKKGAQIDDIKERDEVIAKSKVYLDKAVAYDPKYPTGNYYLGNIYYFINKDKVKAKEYFTIACDNGMKAACKYK